MEANQGIEPCYPEYGTGASPQCLFAIKPLFRQKRQTRWRRLKDLNPHTRTTDDGFLDRCATITRSRLISPFALLVKRHQLGERGAVAGNPGLEPGTLQLSPTELIPRGFRVVLFNPERTAAPRENAAPRLTLIVNAVCCPQIRAVPSAGIRQPASFQRLALRGCSPTEPPIFSRFLATFRIGGRGGTRTRVVRLMRPGWNLLQLPCHVFDYAVIIVGTSYSTAQVCSMRQPRASSQPGAKYATSAVASSSRDFPRNHRGRASTGAFWKKLSITSTSSPTESFAA